MHHEIISDSLRAEQLVGWTRHVVFVTGIVSMTLAVHFGHRGMAYARERRKTLGRLAKWADDLLLSIGLFLFAVLAAIIGGCVALLVLRVVGAA